MGRPVERVLRQTVIAMRLGAVAGLDHLKSIFAKTSAHNRRTLLSCVLG